MIKCSLIVLGSLKEQYLKNACDEYQKRLSGYCDIKIFEIDPVRISQRPSESEILTALDKEAEIIKKKIPQNSAVYAMCIEGRELSSVELAAEMGKTINIGKSLCFIIGSSYGLSKSVKNMADMCISVSRMTFPHQLFRVMLLEQIYRCFKINEGGTYHK